MKLILKVKPFKETPNSGMCGPASLKIVFNYYGLRHSEQSIARLAGVRDKTGVTDDQMIRAAKKLGFEAEVKCNSNFADISYWLRRGVPVIVDWFSPGRPNAKLSEMGDGHASVVYGLDDNYIYLQDPEIGRARKIKREDFRRVWFNFYGKHLTPRGLCPRQIMVVYKDNLL